MHKDKTELNALERFLIVSRINKQHESDFFRIFLDSEIYFIISGNLKFDEGKALLKPGDKLRIKSLEKDEKNYILLFSSLEILETYIRQKHLKDVSYLGMKCGSLLHSIVDDYYIMLNSGAEYSREFTPSEIKMLIKGKFTK